MADTLTLDIDTETAAQLRRLAEEAGESVEQTALRLLAGAAASSDGDFEYQISDEQLAELDRRLANPGPYASPKRIVALLNRFPKSD